MDLVSDKVSELHHVDVADDYVLVEGIAGAAVVERAFAAQADPFESWHFSGVGEVAHDFFFRDAVEDWGGDG